MSELITGPNFSGRSARLRERLRSTATTAFFIGPYAEAALSGLSSTVADEIAIYRAADPGRPAFTQIDVAAAANRKPPTLSGGEQVLLALHCFSRSRDRAIGIDTALEQLDPDNRDDALSYLSREDIDTVLVDNRLDAVEGWFPTAMPASGVAPQCNLAAAAAGLAARAAPAIGIDRLSFRYRGGAEIFREASLTLEPGRVYRLAGPNGAGKTTLFKLLAGALAPQAGALALDGQAYTPWRTGNSVFAYATQNPDHQWCGATLAEDIARRRAALARFSIAMPANETVAALAANLGVATLDQHLYELPLVARKRLSWLWPLSGVMPWIMLDEPTLGQDYATRQALAGAIGRLADSGYGVVFITHDDDFAGLIAHRSLRIADGIIA